ncbi:MAG: carbohydrate binding domain-containing protein, partial [Lachnospiraceae bacterium]
GIFRIVDMLNIAVSVTAAMLVSLAACGKEETNADPTSAPTATEAPAPTATEAPAPTATEAPAPTATEAPDPTESPAPTAEKITIHNITGEKKRDTLYFGSRGSGVAFWGTFGKDSDGSIQVTSRTSTWHGVSLGFTDANYESHDVVGKEVYVSFDVYQESGAPIAISCTLQVNKPDGTQSWPERVSMEDVPSGEWVHIEGVIPVYANASSPSLNFETMGEGSETVEFFLDNVVVSYDPNSSVDPNPDYEPVAKVPFENVSLDFEDGSAYFVARGDSVPTVVDGTLYVSGRTSSWNGAQADFTPYDLAGKTVTVSFKAKHDEASPISINATMQESDGTNTTYNQVASSGDVAGGEWVTVTGSYTVLDTTVAPILYFEATDTASFYIDDVTVTVQ